MELTPLYMDISGVYSGDELGLPYRDIMGEGVVGSGDLAVTQHAGAANLSVDVAAGAAWVLGDTDTNAQPCYRVRNDAVVNKGITPDPSNPRKVVIAAQITDATFSGATRQWAITAIHGTPAASPVEPALPASALKLAVVTVPAGATSIVTANIADTRKRAALGGGVGVKLASIVVTRPSAQSIPSAVETTVAFSTVEGLCDPRGTFALNSSTGYVTVNESGWYQVGGELFYAAAANGTRLAIPHDTDGNRGYGYAPADFANPVVSPPARYLTAGKQVWLNTYQDSGGAVNVTFARMSVVQIALGT